MAGKLARKLNVGRKKEELCDMKKYLREYLWIS